jgi:hypothetical protein
MYCCTKLQCFFYIISAFLRYKRRAFVGVYYDAVVQLLQQHNQPKPHFNGGFAWLRVGPELLDIESDAATTAISLAERAERAGL